MGEWFYDTYLAFFGAGVAVAPEYLLIFLLTGFGVWLWQGRQDRFWRWMLPRNIWAHRSHRIDLLLFVLGRLLALTGLIGRVTVLTGVATLTAGALARVGLSRDATAISPWIVALALFLAYDFSSYWVHRIFHQNRRIWPLHAVHHSAEVLTPFSAYRQHPAAVLISALSVSGFAGLVQGVLIAALSPDLAPAEIAGVNAFFIIAILAMGNFHHSHIWISFGPLLERLVISPAQHQIHHSTLPRHHDKNYGQTLALWDWMFGTLYLIREREELTLGLDDAASQPLMTQRLWPILWDPLRRLWPARTGN